MAIKDDKVIAKLPAEEKQELIRLAESLDVPISQIVREGVRSRIAELQASEQAAEAATV
jgi:predicted DNA-binding protein